MKSETHFVPVGCKDCRDAQALDIDFSMAFQPIVDVPGERIFGYEALVRGLNGEGAASILGQVDDTNRYRFDQACRVKAIDLAARLGLKGMLSINFLPNAVYRPETCIRATLEAARNTSSRATRLCSKSPKGSGSPTTRTSRTSSRRTRSLASRRPSTISARVTRQARVRAASADSRYGMAAGRDPPQAGSPPPRPPTVKITNPGQTRIFRKNPGQPRVF